MAPSFWFFKATRFIRFACKVARDPQERTGAGVAVRQLDPIAACRTSQHRIGVNYIEVLEVWEACPLPKYAWFVPDNCCICTANGSGCVSLGGGDYDGDLLMFTSNPILLRFLDCTPRLLTAMAERAQQQAFNAPDPELDAALIHCVRLAVAAEKAYGAPKKERHDALHALLPRIPLGKAWLPLNQVTLPAAAGH
ncbi:unnamed protein product, partial [Cladocopium goreaui]